MIIDFHVHLQGAVYDSDHSRTGAAALLAAMDQAGIQKAVVQSLDPADNQNILTECARHADRLTPYVLEFPHSAGLQRLPEHINAGARGIGEMYAQPGSKYTLQAYLEPLVEIAKSNHLPILFHTGDFSYTAPILTTEVIRANPQVNFILGHMGSMHYILDAIELLKTYHNVYADTSGMSSPLMLRRAVAECGAEKVLFASDYPFWHPEVELKRVQVMKFSKKAERKILEENAARLLRI